MRFRARSSIKLGREQKKEWPGKGRGKKEMLARKPQDFEKLRSPTNTAFDWCGAGGVAYLALETSIKPGMICLRVSQIWSHLVFIWLSVADYKCFGLIFMWIVFVLCEGLWDQSLQIIMRDRAVETREGQFIGNNGMRIWLEKNGLLVGDNINVNQNIGTRH